jgi:hypothetical protein
LAQFTASEQQIKKDTRIMPRYQIIIGRAEQIDFVGTALSVPAKIDSGAYRSSVHAVNIKETTNKDGEKLLKFSLLGHPCAAVPRPLETTRFTTMPVRSSNGNTETRYEVTLKIKIGSKIFNTSFTLADRSNNVYPVLIGRKALKNRFMVDVSRSSVHRMELKKNFGILTPEDKEDLEA